MNNLNLKLRKIDFVNYTAEETGLTKADTSHARDAMMSGAIKGLKSK